MIVPPCSIIIIRNVSHVKSKEEFFPPEKSLMV